LKKIWAIALSALLVFGIAAFTGCAEKEPEEEEPWAPEEEEPWWPIRDKKEEPWKPVEEEPVTEEGRLGSTLLNMVGGCEGIPIIGGFCVSLTGSAVTFCGGFCPMCT
jgi:hypothetical protein